MARSITKCLISEVVFKSNKLHPTLVSFQNGELLPDEAPDIKCGIYIEEHSGKKRTVAMKSKNNCLYKGSEPPHEGNLCRTIIAIRNKNTNKVRLIEADSIQLSRQLLDVETRDDTRNMLDKDKLFTQLSASFGSKRKIRHSELKQRMQYEVHSMSEQLSQVATAVEISQQDLTIPSMAELNTIIPCNRQAESVDQLYQLSDVISSDELDSLHAEAEQILQDVDNYSESKYSKFFYYCLQNLTSNNMLQNIKLLLYAEYIIKFLALPYKDVRKKRLTVCPSEVISAKILGAFTLTSTQVRTRPVSLQEKAVCNVILLGLLVNEFKLNLEPLIQSIKCRSRKRILELSEALGAQLSPDKTYILLKVPLPKPHIPMKRNKKK